MINNRKLLFYFILPIVAASAVSCEIDTKLTVAGGNPPRFTMTGSGDLTSIRIRGPHKQRDAEGEDMYLYWVIKLKGEGTERDVRDVSPVIYGIVPDGYIQAYPENGEAPPLVEGEHYYVQVITNYANGDDGHFTIHNGKVRFAKYEYQLKEP
jgi:hypothetical protein